MQILDGFALAASLRADLAVRVASLSRKPHIVDVVVGDNPATMAYVGAKAKAAQSIGMLFEALHLPESVSQIALIDAIHATCARDEVDGILVQMPLPSHISTEAIIDAIDPTKDVDGFALQNTGSLARRGEAMFLPCTPAGMLRLLDEYAIPLVGKHVVIVGRSNIVGKPFALLALARWATVSICHSQTQNLQVFTSAADILVVAVGKPKFITWGMVKDGVVVVDVGISRIESKLVWDVDFDSVAPKASAITPVPRGVGPMTVAMLLDNAFKSAQRRISR